MPRNMVQDVLPPEKRSIRNIPVSSARKPRRIPEPPKPDVEDLDVVDVPPILTENPFQQRSKKKFGWKLWAILIALVLIVVIVLMTIFSSSTVLITPKQQKINADEVFMFGSEESEVPYEVVTLNKEGSKTIDATENQTVEESASGTIVVYNNYSSASQRLIKNTRFESPGGLIYRIKDSITVPGQTTKDGKKVPGSIEVTVYADSPGDKYNIDLVDFTIPGFKGDPRFDGFYARSKTAMTGGFIGQKKKPSNVAIEAAVQSIKIDLEGQLTQGIRSNVPTDFVLYNDAVEISFDEDPKIEISGDSAKVSLGAVARGAIFSRNDLENVLVEETAKSFNKQEVDILGLTDMTFTITEKSSVSLKDHDSFKATLKGPGTVVAIVPQEKIKSELAGKSKKVFQVVMSSYSDSIAEAVAKQSPFWKFSFPSDPEKISIELIITP